MVVASHVIAKQRWRLIQIHDQDVDVAVVIEVPKCCAATGVRRGNTRTGLVQKLLKFSVPQISEDDARALERVIGQNSLDFGVNAPSDPEEIGIAVIVEIEHAS